MSWSSNGCRARAPWSCQGKQIFVRSLLAVVVQADEVEIVGTIGTLAAVAVRAKFLKSILRNTNLVNIKLLLVLVVSRHLVKGAKANHLRLLLATCQQLHLAAAEVVHNLLLPMAVKMSLVVAEQAVMVMVSLEVLVLSQRVAHLLESMTNKQAAAAARGVMVVMQHYRMPEKVVQVLLVILAVAVLPMAAAAAAEQVGMI